MKAAPFNYFRPQTVSEVHELCNGFDADQDFMFLAGGQTLVPLMAMRFARPDYLVDLNDIAELQGIENGDNVIRIGAMTRQQDCLADPTIQSRLPLLAKALPLVGHRQTRNRGTIGGSIANADPASEIPLIAQTLQAQMIVSRRTEIERIPADQFFDGPMTTCLKEDDLLIAVEFPIRASNGPTVGTAVQEIAPREGDYALVSAVAQISLDEEGRCHTAEIGTGAVGPTPIKLTALETALLGEQITADQLSKLENLILDAIAPESTTQATADYRRRVAPKLVMKTILAAVLDAKTKRDDG